MAKLKYNLFGLRTFKHFARDQWHLSVLDQLSLVCQFSMGDERSKIIELYNENSRSIKKMYSATQVE